MATSIASGARALASRARTQGSIHGGPGKDSNPATPLTPEQRLLAAQNELATMQQGRLDQEIATLTTRYSGDATLAERVAKGRATRNFAASDPSFAGQIAPLLAKVSSLEEKIRKASARRTTGTIGGGSGETLG